MSKKRSAQGVNSAEMRMGADDFVENTLRSVEMSATIVLTLIIYTSMLQVVSIRQAEKRT